MFLVRAISALVDCWNLWRLVWQSGGSWYMYDFSGKFSVWDTLYLVKLWNNHRGWCLTLLTYQLEVRWRWWQMGQGSKGWSYWNISGTLSGVVSLVLKILVPLPIATCVNPSMLWWYVFGGVTLKWSMDIVILLLWQRQNQQQIHGDRFFQGRMEYPGCISAYVCRTPCAH